MEVTVSVAGGDEQTITLDTPTCGDVIEAVGLSRAEATVLIDGTPHPNDHVIETDAVTVMRLIHGG